MDRHVRFSSPYVYKTVCLFFLQVFAKVPREKLAPRSPSPPNPPTPLPEPPPPKTHQAQRIEDVKCDMWQDNCAKK